MPDKVEIEVKFLLDDPATMRARLLELGAISRGVQAELNVRLDDPARTLSACGKVLRLRRIEHSGQAKHILTVKTPLSGEDPAFSVRHEVEVQVEDGETMLSLLELLGFTPFARYERRRETLIYREVEAVLDEMPVGWFMELEGPGEAIRRLAALLGLDMAQAITLSYMQILEQVGERLGIATHDFTFESCRGIHVTPGMLREALR